MATFRKRGPSQWEAQVRKQGYPTQTRTFKTKADATDWSKMIESEMVRGVWVSRVEAESTSLLEALERYKKEIVSQKKGATQELSIIKIYERSDLAHRSLASIRSADIAKLRDEWLKTLKPATVLRRLAQLSHIFSVGRKEWGMESLSNPVSMIRKPQANDSRMRRVISQDAESNEHVIQRQSQPGELPRIIAASSSKILPLVISVALETAMRRGEIVDLKWEHIDLKKRFAHLPSTKNGSARNVPLSSVATKALADAKELVEDDDATDYVFNIRKDAVTKAFERAVARARKEYLDECKLMKTKPDESYLTDLRFHDLRHEAISRLAEIFPLHELTKITGHQDPRMLMRYYHPSIESLAKRLP